MTTDAVKQSSAVTSTPPAVVDAGKGRRIAGIVLTTIATLFLLFDAASKIVMPPQVSEAFARLGVPARLSPTIAVMLLVSTAFYAIPRTSIFGAVLLTGFLGGAVAIQMRAGSPVFETMFPLLFAILIWAGIYLRECRLTQILPVRR